MRPQAALLSLLALAAVPGIAAPPPVPDDGARSPIATALSSLPAPPPPVVRRVSRWIEEIRQAPDFEAREAAVDGILSVGRPALPLVLAELEHGSRRTWPVMIYLLGAIGGNEVIPVLEQQLSHQSGPSRREVLYALALAGRGPEALVAALRGGDALAKFEGQMTVVDYIAGLLGKDAVPLLQREIPRRTRRARLAGFSALGTVCDDGTVPFLLAWSKQPLASDRCGALLALARIGDPRAPRRLLEALGDRDPNVQLTAALGLGFLRSARAIPALAAIVRRPGVSPVKSRATWSLGLIGGPEAARVLVRAWSRADGTERDPLVRALALARDPAAVPVLLEAALDPNNKAAPQAVEGLAQIEGSRASDALLMVCGGATRHDLGMEAALALVRRKDPRAIPCTIQRLRDEFETRHGLGPRSEEILRLLPLAAPASAADSLEALAGEFTAPALRHRLLVTAHAIRLAGEYGADPEPWIRLLAEGTPDEVDLAIERLGDLGDPRAVEPLCRLFGRVEPGQAWRIPRALGRIGSERATSFLVSLLTDDLYRAPELLRARTEAARALARYSRAPHVAEALLAFYRERHGRALVPLLAYAYVRGKDAIPVLLEEKRLLLRHHGIVQARRHARVNWVLRLLRSGRELRWEDVRDVNE